MQPYISQMSGLLPLTEQSLKVAQEWAPAVTAVLGLAVTGLAS